ncbi:MAG: riboflavin biosynthesis protein RibF [Tannerellaceae bacterium]|nr:riboflavin biosynthesis protein RibF [Tannerellaceae bacterium]
MIVLNQGEYIKEKGLAVTIGFFDGVHKGHRYLIRELINLAHLRGLPAGIVTFRIHPRAVLHADYQPHLLTTYEEKLQQLSTTGIDYCLVLDFTPEMAQMTAGDFMKNILASEWGVKFLLTGYDHRFGHDQPDDFLKYAEVGKENGIEVMRCTAYEENELHVSSSVIRSLLQKGDVKTAASLLTYPYQLSGHIISGNRIGRTIGFPTANIRMEEEGKVIPACGVYGVEVICRGISYKGMLHIGNRPTLRKGDELSVEVHILEFEEDIYGEQIIICFKEYIRENVKFVSLDALQKQLEKDKQTILQLMK